MTHAKDCGDWRTGMLLEGKNAEIYVTGGALGRDVGQT
jgi:hypothetical protein